MQTVIIQEKISVWQDTVYEFEDDVDLSTKAKVKQAIDDAMFWDCSTKDFYWETVDLLERDMGTVELDGVQYPKDENQIISTPCEPDETI